MARWSCRKRRGPCGEFHDDQDRPLVTDPVEDVSDPAVGVVRLSARLKLGGSSGYLGVRQ